MSFLFEHATYTSKMDVQLSGESNLTFSLVTTELLNIFWFASGDQKFPKMYFWFELTNKKIIRNHATVYSCMLYKELNLMK